MIFLRCRTIIVRYGVVVVIGAFFGSGDASTPSTTEHVILVDSRCCRGYLCRLWWLRLGGVCNRNCFELQINLFIFGTIRCSSVVIFILETRAAYREQTYKNHVMQTSKHWYRVRTLRCPPGRNQRGSWLKNEKVQASLS